MSKFDKEILVIDRATLFAESYFQGFSPADVLDYYQVIQDNYFYKRRGDAEENSAFKQPIAYAVIVNEKNKQIFAYQRANNENYSEERLRGRWSWGIGGHIDQIDSEETDPIITSLKRELQEEVELDEISEPQILGFINDDETRVGEVHFGILFLIKTNKPVKPKDAEISWGGFMSYDELEDICTNTDCKVETWSEISLEPVRKALGLGEE